MPREIQKVTHLYGVQEIHMIPNRVAQIKALQAVSNQIMSVMNLVSSREEVASSEVEHRVNSVLKLEFDEEGRLYSES